MTATRARPATAPAPAERRPGGAMHVFRAERRKLSSQLAIRILALICVVGPFAFASILRVQNGSPSDTLYGAWAHSSGFAVSLVILSFSGAWGLPLVAGIVAGDMFSAEDRYGTWKLILTRSCIRSDVFVGKLLAATMFSIGFVALTATSSLVAGLLLFGGKSLVSLSGTVLSPAGSLGLVIVSWLLTFLPTLAFGSLAVLLSIVTRNGIMGVIGPGIATLTMQLLAFVGTGVWAHMLLVSSAYNGWTALFSAHRFYGPLLIGLAVSVIWTGACLIVAWRLVRRRDFAGTPVTRRQGWVMPVRVVLAFVAVIAFFAIAGNWGPVGVTPARLNRNLSATFNNLAVLQQRELGRPVPAGAKLSIVPFCSRRGSSPQGPGDWACTLDVVIPTTGSLPPEPTPVTYDVSVQSDGCYKAQSPPSFVGQQTIRNRKGQSLVNPLYTIYGCINIL